MQSSVWTSSAGPHPLTPRAAPPWRIVAMLALLVLLAHAVLLQTQPARMGPQSDPASQRVPAFATRSIALPPAPPETVAPPDAPAPPAQPAAPTRKKPVFKQNKAPAQYAPATPAIESIAEPIQENRIHEAPDMASAPDTPSGAPEAPAAPEAGAPADLAATGADTATAAAAPASAASTPPPGASQTPVTAMALPASAHLDYKMTGSSKGLSYHANGELAWQNTGSSYNVSMTVKALFIGSRTLRSTGQVSDQGLAPSRFSDKSRTEVAAHFEPDKGQISFSANTPAVPWSQGAQDRVSVFMQLGGMLAGNPAAFPVGSSISMRTVGPRDADNWTFFVENEEPLSLPFGSLATVKLSRKPRHEYDQKLDIWYAPALGYLPVRNKITQANGDFVDQELKALTRP
ncbi:MAG: DUF3108 domain-containing protein [Polaromonas sp.]